MTGVELCCRIPQHLPHQSPLPFPYRPPSRAPFAHLPIRMSPICCSSLASLDSSLSFRTQVPVAGAIGVVCLFLASVGLAQLPFEWQGALLILVAFLLFTADIFLPSLGALTVAGLALLIGGSFLLFDQTQGVAVSQPLVWSVAAALLALFALIGGLALAVLRRKPATGREGLIGTVGTVRQALNPDSFVFVKGELWLATAAGDGPAGTPPIRVPRASGGHRHGWVAIVCATGHGRLRPPPLESPSSATCGRPRRLPAIPVADAP